MIMGQSGFPEAEGRHLVLLEGGVPKPLPLAGVLAYHADGRHVGAVLGYLLVERLVEALPRTPDRRAIAIRSGHPGSGMEDALEFLLRALTGGRYERASFPDGPTVSGAPGTFRFEARIGSDAWVLALRPGVLDPALFAKPDPSDPSDAARRRDRQAASIAALLAMPGDRIFDLLPLSSGEEPGIG